MNLNYFSPIARVIACLFLLSAPIQAQETTIKEDAKNAGRAIGSAVREVKEGAKETGKAVGSAAKEGAEAVVDAVTEGGKEFRRTVTGEKK